MADATTTSSRTITEFPRSDAYRAQVHAIIPGGAHTYSKGDDQFPQLSPAAIDHGLGGRVWDIDGHEYVDCSLALGAVSLGHAYEPVLNAVRAQLARGVNFQRPAAIELEFGREFLAAMPGADRVKFAKNGSTVTSAAVKLARAFTGRDLIAFPGNHSFYSYDDWFIGSTLCASGVPDATKPLSVRYDSTKPETLDRLFHEHKGRIACVITEPEEVIPGPTDTLPAIVELARANGAVFIADEMVTGYRAGWPGACAKKGIVPDLATWGKAMGNGFSFCALTGRADIMDLGGITQSGAERVFLISTTHGGEAHGIAAAQAVMRTYQTEKVIERQGKLVADVAARMKAAVSTNGLDGFLDVFSSGWRVITVARDANKNVSAAMRTLLMQEMIGRGVLFQGLFLPCFTHTSADVKQIGDAFEASCHIYKEALALGPERFLVGPVVRPVFRKFNGCLQVCPSTPCPLESECRVRDGAAARK